MSGDEHHKRLHEEGRGHEASRDQRWNTMRRRSALDEGTERLVSRTIGCAIAVHSALGPGLLEAIYVDALTIELALAGIQSQRERPVMIEYRGVALRQYRVDLVVGELVVVEVKSVRRLDTVHEAQVASYLRAMGLRVGLLLNFNTVRLVQGLRRIVV